MPAVSNTSPISNLATIGRLNLLNEPIPASMDPKAVDNELQNVPDAAVRKVIDAARQQGWLKTRAPSDAALVSLLSGELHPGEAEAIALALEMKADHLLIDEREGRVLARQLGLTLTGVLGVLLRAKKQGHIKVIRPEIEALRNKARFFIAPALEASILAGANE